MYRLSDIWLLYLSEPIQYSLITIRQELITHQSLKHSGVIVYNFYLKTRRIIYI